ncbi:hypothetical protein [Haloprofundus salinisoli]|nr:hypothetical protein [Haloprofundus salinisoli]
MLIHSQPKKSGTILTYRWESAINLSDAETGEALKNRSLEALEDAEPRL